MWPWGHLAFGYLAYSMGVRAWTGRPPRGWAVLVLALSTQVPDLVDKTLSWVVPVFDVGYAVGHSILVAAPALALAGMVAARADTAARGGDPDRPDGHQPERPLSLVAAYGVGHLSHLVGDVVYPVLLGEGLAVERVLWPLATLPPAGARGGAVERVLAFLTAYLARVDPLALDSPLVLPLWLVVGVFGLWLLDGRPGPGTLWRAVTGRRRG